MIRKMQLETLGLVSLGRCGEQEKPYAAEERSPAITLAVAHDQSWPAPKQVYNKSTTPPD
jgi:hypothetical protein